MDWAELLNRRAERIRRAEVAVARPASRVDALSGWRFRDNPALLERAWTALESAPLRPCAASLSLALAPDADLPVSAAGDGDEQLARWRLFRALGRVGPSPVADSEETRKLWAVEALIFLGEQIEHRERGAWGRADYAPDPAQDAAVASWWRRVLTGPPAALWADKVRWEALLIPEANLAFRQVLSTRDLPPGLARQAGRDLADGLWFQLLGAADGPPGFRDLAARVLETGPPGPVDALVGLLDDGGWGTVGACATGRGTWPATLGLAMPELSGGAARALALRSRLIADPTLAEPLLDLHVWTRLLHTWASPDGADPQRAWSVVVQNRGRARSRLRALCAELPGDRLATALAALPGLSARTAAATRRYAWDLAWAMMAHGFAWDWGRPLSAACVAPPSELDPIEDAALPALRTWVLLVMIKGRLGHLRRWVETGGTGDRDGTWGRLLSEELPETLRDPLARGEVRRAATYSRLRAWLADGLDETVAGWRGALRDLVALPAGRALRRDTEALLLPVWDQAAPFPKAGFPTFQANAAAVLAETEPSL